MVAAFWLPELDAADELELLAAIDDELLLPALLCSSQPASIAMHSTVSITAKIFLSLIFDLRSYLLPHIKVPADATADCHSYLVLKIRIPQQGFLLIIADKCCFDQGCRHG